MQSISQKFLAAAALVLALTALPHYSSKFYASTISFIQSPPDTAPPQITGVAANNIAATGATIVWTTDETASSRVDYGATTNYGSTTTAPARVKVHSVNLVGLTPSTLYHFRVQSADAANNLSTSGDFTFVTAAAPGGSVVAGLPDDNKVRLPPNYTAFAPPALGAVYSDPVFRSTITRLSNGLTQFNDGVHHEYAVPSPFNKDNTRILLATHHKGFYVADRSGRVICSPDEMVVSNLAEPRWSVTEPNVFYFHEGNQLKKYDIVTKQKTLVRAFTQFKDISFGKGESDISLDGDHLIIVGDESVVGLYTISTSTLGKTAILATPAGTFDHCDVTPKNNVICRFNGNGVGRYKGYELYDANMKFLRQAFPWGAHSDRGLDVNGDEVLVIAAYNDLSPPPGCENNGVEKVSLSTGKKTCLLPLYWNSQIHVSANTDGKNPWVLVSVMDLGETAGATLPADWQKKWGVRFNELILVRIDGKEARRLAHHRSRTLDDYWSSPRAAISRDGRYVLFDSNFGAKPRTDYTDAYLLDLAAPALNITQEKNPPARSSTRTPAAQRPAASKDRPAAPE